MLLSIEQRLNLLLLVGGLECKTIAETRTAWGLLDRLELTAEEKESVGLTANGNGFQWKTNGVGNLSEIELSEAEVGVITSAIQKCPQWIAGMTRNWLRPLLEQIEGKEFNDKVHLSSVE